MDTALARFQWSRDAYDQQRQREQEDLAFQVPELQWDQESRRQRESTVVGNLVVPARPTLSIPKLDQPVQMLLNQQRAAHLGVQIHALSEDANSETAETIQGLYRAIERESRAQLARGWAFERAVKCGLGFYRVNTVYDEDTANPFDQKIVIQRILHQDAVFLDPAAQQPDWSDGQFAFLCTWMSLDAYRREYPNSQVSTYRDHEALRALYQETPDWVRLDGSEAQQAVLVAEYWRKDYRDREVVALPDGRFVYTDELPAGTTVPDDAPRRTVRDCVVRWSVINGVEAVMPETEWNGKYIPIVPVVGRELVPFSQERRWVGMIRPARDGQRLYNFAASNAVEIGALEPRAPWLMQEGQDEDYEQQWAEANTRNFPVLKYKPTTLMGQPAPPPQRVPIDGNRLTVSMQLLAQADQFIQTSTAVFDPSLGRLNNTDRSGRAVLALQQQSDAGSSHYLDNLATIAMTYEAKVVLDLLPRIYDRAQRVVQILNGEDDPRMVMLNAPFVQNPRTQRPQAVPPGMPLPPKAQLFDLRKGVYGVSVSVGRTYQTRLEEGAQEIGQILQAAPGLMPIIGPTYFKFRDFPGAREIADLLKTMRAQQYPFLDHDKGQNDPAALQAHINSLQQQLQQAQQHLKQAAMELETKQAQQQAQIDVARLKAEADLAQTRLQHAHAIQVQAMKDATALELRRMDAMTRGVLVTQQAEYDAMAQGLDHAYDATQRLVAQTMPVRVPRPPTPAALPPDAAATVRPVAAPDEVEGRVVRAPDMAGDAAPRLGLVQDEGGATGRVNDGAAFEAE